jgi:antirestriction protein ArdC
MAFKKSTEKVDIYQMVTDRIIAKLEQGVVPWEKPWNAKVGMPKNLITGKEYQGMNLVLLGSQNYDNPYWLSYKQATEKGGSIRKGEKGSIIVYWSYLDKTTGKPANLESDSPQKTKSKDIVPILRYYTVFNANQCDNIKTPEQPQVITSHNPIKEAADIIAAMKNAPDIKHGFTKACYNRGTDIVSMPAETAFKTPEHYYSTLFHEVVHSTGHETRLDRKFGTQFGDQDYAKEELVAEMGAAFLCAKTGIDNTAIRENEASYIQSWLKALQDDRKLVVVAAGHAQKAVNLITNTLEKEKEQTRDKGISI